MRGFGIAALALVLSSLGLAGSAPEPLPPDVYFFLPVVKYSGNVKHGLAWSYGSADQDAWSDYNVSWYYHWSSKGWAWVPDSIEFVPTIWCDDAELWERATQNIPKNFDGYILLANEPEFPDQCNATPDRVAELVHRARDAFPEARLVAPQTHVCWWEDSPPRPPCGFYGERFTVEAFISAYRVKYGDDPPLAAYGVHYGDPTFWVGHLSEFLDSKGIDAMLWYSEFNFCTTDLGRFRSWLDHLNRSDRVLRYAYWSNRVENDHCALSYMDTGVLTPLGVVYRGEGR